MDILLDQIRMEVANKKFTNLVHTALKILVLCDLHNPIVVDEHKKQRDSHCPEHILFLASFLVSFCSFGVTRFAMQCLNRIKQQDCQPLSYFSLKPI